jgi:hypothetical protein
MVIERNIDPLNAEKRPEACEHERFLTIASNQKGKKGVGAQRAEGQRPNATDKVGADTKDGRGTVDMTQGRKIHIVKTGQAKTHLRKRVTQEHPSMAECNMSHEFRRWP